MPVAARITDPIQHSNALMGLLVGAAIGLAIGIATVATGGAALVVIATVGASMCAGAAVGQLVGSLDVTNSILGGIVTGSIVTGSGNVKVNSLKAVRATDDSVSCAGTPPIYFPDHQGKKVAQGSGTVFINGQPASRIGDKIVCSSSIKSGSSNVVIGGPTVTTLPLESEIPEYISKTLLVIGVASAVILAGPIAAALGLIGGYYGAQGGAWLGGKLFGEGSDGQKIFEFLGGMAGGAAGGKIGSSGRLGSWNQAAKCKMGLEPIDLGSGHVVDSAVDMNISGLIALIWQRNYNSAGAHEKSALGFGGWTHSFDQWVITQPGRTSVRDEEGRDVYFPLLQPGQTAFHRSDRLLLTALEGGSFQVYSLTTRLLRLFSPLAEGTKAMLRAVRDAYGNELSLQYENGFLSKIVDTAGRQARILNDHTGRVMRMDLVVHERVEQSVQYAYASRGELASVTDALGNSERYAYDADRRMVCKTLKNGVRFYYEYDEKTGWCCRSWGDGGLHSGRIRVDGDNRITYLEENEEPRVLHWNEDGLVTREELPDGTLIGTWEYDSDLYLVAEANGAGETTRHEYDARGNRTRTIDPAGNITEYAYTDDLPSRRVGPDQLETRYWHGSKGELLQIAYPTGVHYRLDYDTHGRLVSINEGEHVVRQFGYDERHDCTNEVDGRGASTRYAYDALGRATARIDALGHKTLVEYDLLGRAIAITAADGTVTKRTYDAYGHITREIDPLGGATEMEYGGTGKLTKMVRPDGTIWNLRYDGIERLCEIFNPHGEQYAFDYDQAGRVIAERTFDGRTLKYAYSDAGRVSSIFEPDGATRELHYDRLGSVTSDKTADAAVTFERDKLGRLVRATLQERSGKVVTSFLRDELGMVVEERQNERSLHYRYDRFGRRTERALSDGSTTRYGYDPDHALSFLEHNGKRFVFERDVLGREVSRRSGPKGFAIRNAYDALDRLTERSVEGGQTPLATSKRTWKYDELGRVIEIDDDRWGLTTYRYDAIGQLLQAKRRSYCEVFHYDATGSLRKIFEGLKGPRRGKAWDTAPGNLLQRSDHAEYAYDTRGRRIKKTALVEGEGTRAGEVTQYRWDDRDRLREVLKPSGDRVLFTYDAFGRRVRKEVLPASGDRRVVEFVWDGDELAGDFDSSGGARVFVHEPGTFVPALQAEQGEVFAVVNDHLGMPKELIDAEGKVAWSAAHSAWGKVVEEHTDEQTRRERKVESPFRLLGQYADDETGLCYTRFRYFDAETGRWCSPDPLGIEGGQNLSGLDGAPCHAVDPLGLACYTQQSREHNYTHGHAANSPRLPGKSRFRPTEGGQKFTDEVINHPQVTVTPQSNGRIKYEVPNLGRQTGWDRHGNPAMGGTVIVEGQNPASWSTYVPDEVVTQYPSS